MLNPIRVIIRCYCTLRWETMKVEIDNVKTVIETEITKDGRIYGLKKYARCKVKVVVLENKK
jgi:hypothetical protein